MSTPKPEAPELGEPVRHKAIAGPTVQPVPTDWRDRLAEIRDQLEEGDDHE